MRVGIVSAARRVRAALLGSVDDRPCALVELLAVADLLAQSRPDQQSVARIDAQAALVEHDVHVRGEQQAVVEPVLAARPRQALRPIPPHLSPARLVSGIGLIAWPLRSSPGREHAGGGLVGAQMGLRGPWG